MISVSAGDRVIMKKPHACGANDWEVFRTGADIKLKCKQCGHMIIMTRTDFERAAKKITRCDDVTEE